MVPVTLVVSLVVLLWLVPLLIVFGVELYWFWFGSAVDWLVILCDVVCLCYMLIVWGVVGCGLRLLVCAG